MLLLLPNPPFLRDELISVCLVKQKSNFILNLGFAHVGKSNKLALMQTSRGTGTYRPLFPLPQELKIEPCVNYEQRECSLHRTMDFPVLIGRTNMERVICSSIHGTTWYFLWILPIFRTAEEQTKVEYILLGRGDKSRPNTLPSIGTAQVCFKLKCDFTKHYGGTFTKSERDRIWNSCAQLPFSFHLQLVQLSFENERQQFISCHTQLQQSVPPFIFSYRIWLRKR